MNGHAGPEYWAKLVDWPGYEIETTSGRCRSVPRVIVSSTGQRQQLQGYELVQCGPSRIVTLSRPGYRRTFTPGALVRMALADE